MMGNAIKKILGKWKSPEDGQEYLAVEMDADVYHNRGMEYLEAKRYGKAAKMFKKEIECDHETDIGYHSLGKALEGMGKKEEAKRSYEIALAKAEEMRRMDPGIDEEIIEEIREDIERLEV